MAKNLTALRKSYEKGSLLEQEVASDPITQFASWFEDYKNVEDAVELNPMTLSTLGTDGFPKGRIVLLKKFDVKGFYFYTNYTSDKGLAIASNDKVSLAFFWPSLERQVIVKGMAHKTSREDSVAYFNSRPLGSRLGAIASDQSSIVENRSVLEERLKLLEKKYSDSDKPPCPEDWGGYYVIPQQVEFWQGRPNRLHDRLVYEMSKDGSSWQLNRLAP